MREIFVSTLSAVVTLVAIIALVCIGASLSSIIESFVYDVSFYDALFIESWRTNVRPN